MILLMNLTVDMIVEGLSSRP